MERELQIVAQESAIAVADQEQGAVGGADHRRDRARAGDCGRGKGHHRQRATEIAERDKIINVTAARKAAETEAMPITVMAEAENQAATNKAEAINVLAKADANAATTRAAGVKALGQAEAEVATLKAEARNKLSRGDDRLRSQRWRASTSSRTRWPRRSSRSRRSPTSGSSTPAACSAAAAATAP